jgi:hypothetical protein
MPRLGKQICPYAGCDSPDGPCIGACKSSDQPDKAVQAGVKEQGNLRPDSSSEKVYWNEELAAGRVGQVPPPSEKLQRPQYWCNDDADVRMIEAALDAYLAEKNGRYADLIRRVRAEDLPLLTPFCDAIEQLQRELADSRSGMDEANKRWLDAREVANRETLNANYWKDKASAAQHDLERAVANHTADLSAASATPAMSFTPAQAVCILKVRDALLAKDVEEAYHWLYTLDSKQMPHDPFKPWADLERIAAADNTSADKGQG